MSRPRRRITLRCQICHSGFDVIPYRKDSAKYCSHACHMQALHRKRVLKNKPRIILCPSCKVEKKHYSRGYCRNCYDRQFWNKTLRCKQAVKRYYESHKQQVSERVKKWKVNNREKTRLYSKRTYYLNGGKEKILAWQRWWRATLKGKMAVKKRSMMKRGGGSWSDVMQAMAFNYLRFGNYRCEKCGVFLGKLDFFNGTVDHIIPLLLGGKNYFDNLQILCGSCNSKKYTKTIDYRYQSTIKQLNA